MPSDTVLTESRPGSALSIGGISLIVHDLDRVSRFYREVIGLQEIDRDRERVRLGVDGSAFVELLARPGAAPRDPAAAGLYHTAFLLPTRDDLGRWLAHAAALGLALDGAADHLVSEAVYLHDPEGNGIEVYADRPPTLWRWIDGQVEMANDRLDLIGLTALASTRWQGAPSGTKIGHVHLQVGAIPPAEQFYAGMIGVKVTRRWPKALFLSSSGYHHHLAANIWHSAGAGPRAPGAAGLAQVTLLAVGSRLGDGLTDPWGLPIRFASQTEGVFA